MWDASVTGCSCSASDPASRDRGHSGPWVPATHVGDQDEALTPVLGLMASLDCCGEKNSRWKLALLLFQVNEKYTFLKVPDNVFYEKLRDDFRIVFAVI